MYDFTKEIEISKKDQKWYILGRFVLYLLFLVFVAYAFVKIVFPNHYGYFDFTQYYGAENTLLAPRLSNGEITRGPIPQEEVLIFNTVARGEFEKFRWVGKKAKASPELSGEMTLVQAYRAMLYPEGSSVLLREGSLVSYDGVSYIVSREKLRAIPSAYFSQLGFSQEQFTPLSEEEFLLHEKGDDVGEDEYWIEGSLFRIDDDFYQVREGRIDSFVSARAYLSQYQEKDARMLNRIAPDSDISQSIGFSSGMLLGYEDGVYVSEGAFLRPITSPEAFLSKGYEWDWVIPITQEEFSAYDRGEIYTEQRPHSSGTLFYDKERNLYFIIDSDKKRMLKGDVIQDQYQSVSKIQVDSEPQGTSCVIQKSLWGTFTCEGTLYRNTGSGAEYQFSYTPKSDVSIEEMKTLLIRGVNESSFRVFLTDVRSRILRRFGV